MLMKGISKSLPVEKKRCLRMILQNAGAPSLSLAVKPKRKG